MDAGNKHSSDVGFKINYKIYILALSEVNTETVKVIVWKIRQEFVSKVVSLFVIIVIMVSVRLTFI